MAALLGRLGSIDVGGLFVPQELIDRWYGLRAQGVQPGDAVQPMEKVRRGLLDRGLIGIVYELDLKSKGGL